MTTPSRAFTLLETVVVIAIMMVLALVLYNFFFSSNTFFLSDRALIATADTASSVVSAVERATHEADHVLASHLFSNGTTYTTSLTTLVLELPSVDASGALISGSYDYIAFYLTGTTLYELTDAAAGSKRISGLKQLSALVQTLTLVPDNENYPLVKSVTISITTATTVKAETLSTQLHEQIYLRNRPS